MWEEVKGNINQQGVCVNVIAETLLTGKKNRKLWRAVITYVLMMMVMVLVVIHHMSIINRICETKCTRSVRKNIITYRIGYSLQVEIFSKKSDNGNNTDVQASIGF